MIRAGVLGAAGQIAGELIRLLTQHPEVDLEFVYAPEFSGRSLSSVHLGLIGESQLRFIDSFDATTLDVVFICDVNLRGFKLSELPDSVKVIFMNEDIASEYDLSNYKDVVSIGVSELFRKPLVRGARMAVLRSVPEVITLISLYPLALGLLLNDNIKVKLELPEWLIPHVDVDVVKNGINNILSNIQLSFIGVKDLTISSNKSTRAVKMIATMPCKVAVEEIEKIYDGIYDDHNFTFMVNHTVYHQEVEGTQKVIIRLIKDSPDILKVEALSDAIMRGGAGDAVHVLNLLFGLFEKTGLSGIAPFAYQMDYNNVGK